MLWRINTLKKAADIPRPTLLVLTQWRLRANKERASESSYKRIIATVEWTSTEYNVLQNSKEIFWGEWNWGRKIPTRRMTHSSSQLQLLWQSERCQVEFLLSRAGFPREPHSAPFCSSPPLSLPGYLLHKVIPRSSRTPCSRPVPNVLLWISPTFTWTASGHSMVNFTMMGIVFLTEIGDPYRQ